MSRLGKNFLKRCLTPVRNEERAEWLNEEESGILGRGSREQRPGSHSASGADTQEAQVAADSCAARGRQSLQQKDSRLYPKCRGIRKSREGPEQLMLVYT